MSGKKLAGGSLAMKIVLPVLVALLVGFGASTWFGVSQSSQTVNTLSNNLGEEVAQGAAVEVESEVTRSFTVARGIAAATLGQIETGTASRASILASLRQMLADNPALAATWVAFEPGAFDGKDAEFVGAEGHDTTGRFVPYVARTPEGSSLSALTAYEEAGAGDYYLLARNSGKEQFLEPYLYEINGKMELITSAAQ